MLVGTDSNNIGHGGRRPVRGMPETTNRVLGHQDDRDGCAIPIIPATLGCADAFLLRHGFAAPDLRGNE